jgi:GNAT superfamily N-acetyltransferase
VLGRMFVVSDLKISGLDETEHIFDSIKDDYKDFDVWVNRIKEDVNRFVKVVTVDDVYVGVAIVKVVDFSTKDVVVSKISTFKVHEEYQNQGIGTLLLNTVENDLVKFGSFAVYVDVKEHHVGLIDFLVRRGYHKSDTVNDLFLSKKFVP